MTSRKSNFFIGMYKSFDAIFSLPFFVHVCGPFNGMTLICSSLGVFLCTVHDEHI